MEIAKVEENEDLNELQRLEGVNVWSRGQDVLEQQALNELKVFKSSTLNIDDYIKKQEQLKKQQEYKRSILVSEASRIAAENAIKKTKKRKQKSEEVNNIKKVKVDGSDSEYIPSEDELEESCSVQTRKAKYTRAPDDGDVKLHKNRLKGYYKSEKVNNIKEIKVDGSDSEYIPSEDELEESCLLRTRNVKYTKVQDDGDVKLYKNRLKVYYKSIEEQKNVDRISQIEVQPGMKLTENIWNNLYAYQQEGVKWLWNLYKKNNGALLGDEMGLGKTVQIIAFLDTVKCSRLVSSYGRYTGLGPTLIITPTTVIHQWVKHFHDWTPETRVAILHQSGTFQGNRTKLIKDIYKDKGVIVTSYQSVLKYQLTDFDWHFVILDEGHKIRNPNAKISKEIKKFRTPYRLLLSGSPMQNNLQELWSLFDFIMPGMLGSLNVFMEHFADPIMRGGYTNANPIQESIALSMATALKTMITPHLLRRDKKSVLNLPKKCEQVLFCSITEEQKDLYKGFILSDQVSNLLGKDKNWFSNNHIRSNVLMSITALRKICNHPDIYLNNDEETANFGHYKRSGKMIVVSALLKIWKRQNHRVLLFTQSRVMIRIFEHFLTLNNYNYLKMDGSTPIGNRQCLIEKFNTDQTIDVFLLTTKVGGLGVNLTGADRVIIYDPDWNPATDTQARERAWRIGQRKDVTVYRLLSAGTIEEKIYQRQVWKQLLSNKVLLDPKTQRFFKSSDLHDLFSLQEDQTDTETANIFKNSRISIEQKLKEKKQRKNAIFTDEKLAKMKELAAKIAKNISQTKPIDAEDLEREKRLVERVKLKNMTPAERLKYNRERMLPVEENETNVFDDCETEVSFGKALVISEKSAELYQKARVGNVDEAAKEYGSLRSVFSKNKCDFSGEIDGEKVENLVKREIAEKKKKKTKKSDDYVLEKLFSKKSGIRGALQHDSIVGGGSEVNSIRMREEAQEKTEIALQALRKSRLTHWRH